MGTKPGYREKKAFLHLTSDSTTTIWTMTAQPPCTFLSKQHVYLHRGINQDNFSSGISSIILLVGDVGPADEP